ncbi:MAG: hypothetical protein AB1486_06010 [Planctomycetota bacterium]
MIHCHPAIILIALLLPAAARGEDPDPETLKALAARCGSEVDWVSNWEEAARRAREEEKPVLVLFRSLAGFDIPDSAMLGPFMNPDIIELVRERYVALRFAKGMDAPFVAQDSYGMGPFAFGTSILIATSAGKIVGDTFTLETSSLYDFLVKELALFPRTDPPADAPAAPPSVPAAVPTAVPAPVLRGADLAAWHLRRGELAQAAALLAHPSTEREHRLRATLLRRERRGEEALAELARACEMGAAGTEADIAVEKAELLMRLERLDEALAALEKVRPQHADAPAALYLKGSLLLGREDFDGAFRAWKELAGTHPENRWAWLAAVLLQHAELITRAGRGRNPWPSEEVLATLERRKPEILEPDQSERAERTALEFLLQAQRPDGSWIVSSEVMSNEDTGRSPLTISSTALSARALLPYLEKPRVEEAVRRSLAFLKAARQKLDEAGEPFGVMDYFVWCLPSMLLFLGDALEAGVAEEAEWKPIMAKMVQELDRKQKPGGGWSYYMGGDVDNLDPALNVSFSFVTAFVLIGLFAADEAGIEIPEDLLDDALACLERMRNQDGTFEYALVHANESAPRTPTPAGAAGRGPLCALALHLWGRIDLEAICTALDQFVTHRHTYAREHGKTVMHCGPEGQGSHYLMFDYAFAAAASAKLPEAERAPYREPLLRQILGARSEAGSYIDNPLLGDHYGTGMALWAFQRLTGEP